MPKIPRDHDPEMVVSLLLNLYDVPEGILYELVELVPDPDAEYDKDQDQEEV